MDTFVSRLRERVGVVVAAALFAACCLVMGLLLTFVISPQQGTEWRQIESLPEASSSNFTDQPADKEMAVTGTLEGNPEQNTYGHVAYTVERWDVSQQAGEDNLYEGNWKRTEVHLPVLTISVDGGEISTAADSTATFGGALHEEIEESQGGFSTEYNGRSLSDGSLRIRGVSNGDLVTIIGRTSGSGSLIPRRVYAGSREQLVNDIRTSSQAAFGAGILMMVCSPGVLILGLLGAAFGGRKKSM